MVVEKRETRGQPVNCEWPRGFNLSMPVQRPLSLTTLNRRSDSAHRKDRFRSTTETRPV